MGEGLHGSGGAVAAEERDDPVVGGPAAEALPAGAPDEEAERWADGSGLEKDAGDDVGGEERGEMVQVRFHGVGKGVDDGADLLHQP